MAAFIKYISIDCADPRRLSAFWTEVTGYQPATEDDDFVALAAPDKRGVRAIFFWKVPEPKVTKNRVHLDLATKQMLVEALAQFEGTMNFVCHTTGRFYAA